jgi:hypothetical protein
MGGGTSRPWEASLGTVTTQKRVALLKGPEYNLRPPCTMNDQMNYLIVTYASHSFGKKDKT